MPHPCSHWAVWTFGKVDPSRRTFDSVTDITDEYRAELASEEAKLGRPDLPKLVHEREEAEEESRVCEDEPCAVSQGRVVVDDGAAEVVSNCGRSLLAVGVVRVVGDFEAGAHVAVVSVAGAAIAAGRTAYAADDLRALAGKRSRCCAELRPQHSGEPGVVMRKADMVLS